MTDAPPEPFPIRTHHLGEPVPDLTQISQEQWLEAVTPLSGGGRQLAMDLAESRGADLVAVTDLQLASPSLAAHGQSSGALHAGLPVSTAGSDAPQAPRRAKRLYEARQREGS